MLLQFSVTQPLEDLSSDIFKRSCSLETPKALGLNSTATIENPKMARYVFESSLDSSPACAVVVTESHGTLELVASSGGREYNGGVGSLLKGMQQFFEAVYIDNCDEMFFFAYHKQTVAGIFIGASLGKRTIKSALKVSDEGLQTTRHISTRTVAQLCGGGRIPDRVFSVSIDATGNLAAVQKNFSLSYL